MKLWPHGLVRPIRFHHLRHTTASLLMMAGANPAAVQRIMRHSDPRLTTEVYGHLAPGYLRSEIDRLQLTPPAPKAPRTSALTASDPDLVTNVLNVANAAKRLGVCTATVYKLCATGALPHVRVLNSIRIEEAALRAFIAAQRRRSSAARTRG